MHSTLATYGTQRAFDRSRPAAPSCDAVVLRPPVIPPRSRTLSGRPSCRIYLGRRAWILEFQTTSGGWMEPWAASSAFKPKRLLFPTLAAAVGYAEQHGFDYRIDPPVRRSSTLPRGGRQLPRSWLARLSSNGRNGDIFHA
jgi:hypothetical protein